MKAARAAGAAKAAPAGAGKAKGKAEDTLKQAKGPKAKKSSFSDENSKWLKPKVPSCARAF